jgi:hypothetical protein
MARFEINQTIVTSEPQLTVDAGLPVGRHRFQLVVEDSSGNLSDPDVAEVTVVRSATPVVRQPPAG